MKITVSKSELFGKLQAIGRIISSKNVLPAYDNFLFQIDDTNYLQVTAGEEGSRISTIIDCQTDFPSISFMLNAKTMLDGLKEIPEQPLIIEIIQSSKSIEIIVRYSNGKFTVCGSSAKEYPSLPTEEQEAPFIISAESFLYGIKKSKICCADDELRPVMNGVYFDRDGEKINYVASNGTVLGLVSSTVKTGNKERSSFILPAKIANLLSNIVSSDCEEITVIVGRTNISFEFDTYKLICRMIEGRYPNYRSVIPKYNDKTAKVIRTDLISALKRVSVFCSASSSLVICDFKNGKLLLSGHDTSFATSAEEEVSLISYSGQPIKVGFKSSYLIDLLSNIPTPEVIITLLDPTRQVLLYRGDMEESDLIYLAMPLFIND